MSEGVNAIVSTCPLVAAIGRQATSPAKANALADQLRCCFPDLTGAQLLTPHCPLVPYDTWALANGTASAMVEQVGDTWFFLTAGLCPFGHALERDTSARCGWPAGGEVRRHGAAPLPGPGFYPSCCRHRSGAPSVDRACNLPAATPPTAIMQEAEFGITQAGQALAGLLGLHH